MNTSTRLRNLADRMGLDGFAEELREIAGELDAKAAPALPQGWKLVPVEPTEEMLAAVSWPGCAHTDWSHMLAAAPTPPTHTAPSQEPVTLTDGLIEKGAMTGMVDAQIDAIITALREKEKRA